MNDAEIRRHPEAVRGIVADTEAMSFNMISETKVGSLLTALAASKPAGRFLELGTGTGHGTAWLLAGMDPASTLDSVDCDEAVVDVARRHLGADPRARFHVMDGAEFLRTARAREFDLIYADAWPGKFSHLDEALALLRPGGVYVIDDLLPQPNWPEGHAAKVPVLIEDLERRDGFVTVKLAWASGIMLVVRTLLVLAMVLLPSLAAAQEPPVTEGDAVLRDFRFRSGETLPELRIHYRTLGRPERDAQGVVRNGVLIMHGTGGSGAQFIRPEFAGELFRQGGLLDATRYFIVLPDGIGHGRSSKPSDGLRGKFPRYGYLDMIEAQYRLLTDGLGVNHLRLVMGTSMGGMQTWLWGERYPAFMDALMPLASLPVQISGRNRVWRRAAIDAIRNDPQWRGGDYTAQPPGLRTAEAILYLMSSSPVLRQRDMTTLASSDAVFDRAMAAALETNDANDVLYQLEASRDYDPGPDLEKIRAPLLAVNSADDLINPPELGILEREIARVPRGRAVIVPAGPDTRGHGTHTMASVWSRYLKELLANTK